MPTKNTKPADSQPQRHEKAEEPSLHGVTPDDPTYQKLEVADPSTRPDTPEARRDAVLRDQAADRDGKPRDAKTGTPAK